MRISRPGSPNWPSRPAFLLAGLLIFPWLCGCAGHKAPSGEARVVTELALPRLAAAITGPAGGFLTNGGFAADCQISLAGIAGRTVKLYGRIYGQRGKIHLAVAPGKAKPGSPQAFGVIWDSTAHAGWVFSEALQGYAAISGAGAGFTNFVTETIPGPPEKREGHPVDDAEATCLNGNGQRMVLHLTRAQDLGNLPLDIQVIEGPGAFAVALTQAQNATPAADLFLAPDGFTKYPSEAALVEELADRQQSVYGQGFRSTDDESGESGENRRHGRE
jgi:hypothetical protein